MFLFHGLYPSSTLPPDATHHRALNQPSGFIDDTVNSSLMLLGWESLTGRGDMRKARDADCRRPHSI